MALKKSGQPTTKPQTSTRSKKSRRMPTEDDIRSRAYEIYLARGGSKRDPADDWLQAERELRS